ncbi:MltR family transcriptional regulator [Rodentibacter trehalosifermentans]|uniref:MltR family transcriptional regulator n=1 Tax=Rodentibacter trehalosifermentans TaxID=1908263 RepID=UPI00098637B3|nr:MltR family transcriptional regulator [Rodentibacter trehalosifermentans]OOF52667.1 MltR family transcriptional regulator [Rodentibacter trehalosifermentans]
MSSDLIYEKLNEAKSVRGFIIVSVATFDEQVGALIHRVFHKADFAVKSVVDSLFETSGPLSDLSVRLKILLGLGVIEQNIFEDISHYIAFKEQLNNDEKEYDFADEMMIEFTRNLYSVKDKTLLDFAEDSSPPDSLLFQMKQQQKKRLLRSCLTLSVTDICEKLQIESPF